MKFTPPTTETEALPARLAQISGDETIRGTPFQAMYDVVTAACGAEILNDLRREAGIEAASFNVMKKYPLKDFLSFERVAAARMAKVVGSFDEAIFRLGAAAIDSFFDSVAGRTMKILAGKEPHRLLSATANGYAVLVNFGAREYVKQGERAGSFLFRGELLGAVHSSGIFDAALRVVYGVEADIKLEASSLTDFKFIINW